MCLRETVVFSEVFLVEDGLSLEIAEGIAEKAALGAY